MEEYCGNRYFNDYLFRSNLLVWFHENQRVFPWRETNDPYHILIAEILLHRTQATQVVEIYKVFIEKYPNPLALMNAPIDEVYRILRSLGLNWRIELIVTMAYKIVHEFAGVVPVERDHLLSLPGVGEYIAAAVRCFAFNIPEAVIDTNVMRVISRVRGIPYKDSMRRNRRFRLIAREMLDENHPRYYNLAILDLASSVCRPKSPDCKKCPVKEVCHYYCQTTGIISSL